MFGVWKIEWYYKHCVLWKYTTARTRYHMSWLPVEKLTTEENEILQDYNKRKATLLGKYNQQIKDLDTNHEIWVETLVVNTRKLQKCQELYFSEQDR